MTREDFIPLATILLLAPRPLEQNEHEAMRQVERAKAMAERVATLVGVGGAHEGAAHRAKADAELAAAARKLGEVEAARLALAREREDLVATVKRLEEELATAKGDIPTGLHDDEDGGENRPRRVEAPPANPAPAGPKAPTEKRARG